jgi:hypothetical protein
MTHFQQAVCDSRKQPANQFARLRQGAKNEQVLVNNGGDHIFASGQFVGTRLTGSFPADLRTFQGSLK